MTVKKQKPSGTLSGQIVKVKLCVHFYIDVAHKAHSANNLRIVQFKPIFSIQVSIPYHFSSTEMTSTWMKNEECYVLDFCKSTSEEARGDQAKGCLDLVLG